MKRNLFILLFAFITFCVSAQNAKDVLEIDQSSFRPVQTDALTGVAIDKIGLDRSKRPCARVKMHINRMTREEIEQIQVRPVGGMVELTKRIVAADGNGLIFELTAKPQTRFYLHHDKFGDSNEVIVNLEPDKEYRMEAQLNLLLSVVVASNVKDADVYLDGVYKGKTGSSYMCGIADVVPGEHTIKVKQGSAVTERRVDVNSENFSFRMELSNKSQAQFVLFEVEPKSAVVMIDNHPHIAIDGFVQVMLHNGTYPWHVMAEGYHPQKGEFTVSGDKVMHKVTLQPDAALVTITSGDGVEIWINGEKRGLSPWKGMLNSGTYRFEARKANHESVTMSQTITSDVAEQSYTLDSPTPILGTLSISSTPPMADILIDGIGAGQTPMMHELLVGKHRVAIFKPGYEYWMEEVNVEKSKNNELMVQLKKLLSDDSATSSIPSEKVKTKPVKEPKPQPVKEPKEPKPVKEPKSQPVKSPKPPKPSRPTEKCYQQSVSLGFDMEMAGGNLSLGDLGINYIGGYRLNKLLYVGLGTGLNIVAIDHAAASESGVSNMYEHLCPLPSKMLIPIYAHLRAYFGKKKFQTFVAMSGGVKLGVGGKPELRLYNDDNELIHIQKYSPLNYFVEPAFGMSLRLANSSSIYMQLGGLIQMRPYYRPHNDYQGALSHKLCGGLTIKVGYTF